MRTMKCFVICVGALVVLAADLGEARRLTAAEKVSRILNRVPKSERQEFIRYHLNKGYELLQEKATGNYPQFHYKISNDDSILLYEYYSTDKVVEDENVVKIATDIICWGDKCIDFSDPGIHP